MTTLIFGTGVGTFILVSVWTVAVILCFISLRTQRGNIGPVAIAVASLVMLILLLIPRGPESPPSDSYKVYDNLFVWRIVLIIFLSVSAAGGFAAYFVTDLMEPKHAHQLKGWTL